MSGTPTAAGSSGAHADLSAVRELMTASSRAIHDSGWHHLIWGSVVAGATVLVQGVSAGWMPLGPGWIWGVAVAVGWILSMVAGSAAARTAPATTGATSVTQRVWIAVGLSLTLFGFVGIPAGAVDPSQMSIITAAMLAGGYFASSVGPALRWFLPMAVLWWLAAAVLILIEPTSRDLAFAAVIIVIEGGVGIALLLRNRSTAL